MEFSFLSNSDKIIAVEGAIKGTERNIYSQCSMTGIDPDSLSYPYEIPAEYQVEPGGFESVVAQAHRALQKLIERRHLLLIELETLRG